jgi:hypothetical protein
VAALEGYTLFNGAVFLIYLSYVCDKYYLMKEFRIVSVCVSWLLFLSRFLFLFFVFVFCSFWDIVEMINDIYDHLKGCENEGFESTELDCENKAT